MVDRTTFVHTLEGPHSRRMEERDRSRGRRVFESLKPRREADGFRRLDPPDGYDHRRMASDFRDPAFRDVSTSEGTPARLPLGASSVAGIPPAPRHLSVT